MRQKNNWLFYFGKRLWNFSFAKAPCFDTRQQCYSSMQQDNSRISIPNLSVNKISENGGAAQNNAISEPVWVVQISSVDNSARSTRLILTYLEHLCISNYNSTELYPMIPLQSPKNPNNCMFVKNFYNQSLSTKLPYHFSINDGHQRWPLEAIFYWLYSIKY